MKNLLERYNEQLKDKDLKREQDQLWLEAVVEEAIRRFGRAAGVRLRTAIKTIEETQ